jgi:hypothetical protein
LTEDVEGRSDGGDAWEGEPWKSDFGYQWHLR